MKALSIFSIILSAVLFSNTSFAQAVKTDTIKVWGNCGMCKETIEKAATSAKATTANWDEETKILQVSFNDSKTSLQKIQQAVAKSGYDTQDFTGDDKAYSKLPMCCKYDRKAAIGKE